MTVVNKKEVAQFFRRKIGRDPFSNNKLKEARTRAAGLRTNQQRKQLRRRLM